MDKRTLFFFGILPFLLFFVAIFYACGNSGGFGGDSPGSFKIIKAVDSPDGKYSATFWEGMGGGAAGWCGQSINIHRKEEIFDLNKIEENRNNQVFAVSCGSDVEMNWKSANHFHVRYSNAASISTNSESKDGAVKISYEVK